MNQCFYDCVNGQLILLSSDCPHSTCPANGGECNDTSGMIIVRPCPPPFGSPNL